MSDDVELETSCTISMEVDENTLDITNPLDLTRTAESTNTIDNTNTADNTNNDNNENKGNSAKPLYAQHGTVIIGAAIATIVAFARI